MSGIEERLLGQHACQLCCWEEKKYAVLHRIISGNWPTKKSIHIQHSSVRMRIFTCRPGLHNSERSKDQITT